jgi:hypothetical protein
MKWLIPEILWYGLLYADHLPGFCNPLFQSLVSGEYMRLHCIYIFFMPERMAADFCKQFRLKVPHCLIGFLH